MPKLKIPKDEEVCYNCIGWDRCKRMWWMRAREKWYCFNGFCAGCGADVTIDSAKEHPPEHDAKWHFENCIVPLRKKQSAIRSEYDKGRFRVPRRKNEL